MTFPKSVDYLKCATVVVDVGPVQKGHDGDSALNRTDLDVRLDFESNVLDQTLADHDSNHLQRTKMVQLKRLGS